MTAERARSRARGARMRSPTRRRVILCGWTVVSLGLLARGFQLQLIEGEQWRARAEQQQQKTEAVPAPRGVVLDRDGVPLAISHEVYRVAVAPQELEDRAGVARLLAEALGIPRAQAQRAVRSDRSWVRLPGIHSPAVRNALSGVTGIHFERELRRFYPHGDLAQGVLGTVDDVGIGRGGIEQQFDDVLRGVPGQEVVARDADGRAIPGESWLVREPQRGKDVVLTIDLELQEIGHQALKEAMAATGAVGGDLLITEPSSGEILALVSLRTQGRASLSAVTTPYEPGSTLKPFTVAALLTDGLASLGDSVNAENGAWTKGSRTITDVHPYGMITLADALRVSSNIGIAKMATRLPRGTHYQYLRDFGFGTPTGVQLPGESAGILRRPRNWSDYSTSSLAIGYEMSVTPMQMAMAYGALANGGLLLEPRIVREVRDPSGRAEMISTERLVRRVVPATVTARLVDVLVDVVADGTATAASLAHFTVAGKTGTSRSHSGEGYYERGRYQASFVGFFPAEAPQLVVFVKLDHPEGAYYGGLIAAPVTRATLEAVLAARQGPLNRWALAAFNPPPEPRAESAVRFASRSIASGEPAVSVPPVSVRRPLASGAEQGLPIPDVSGLPVRIAVRRLHALGLRVAWPAAGTIVGTAPAAGEPARPGSIVRLQVKARGL